MVFVNSYSCTVLMSLYYAGGATSAELIVASVRRHFCALLNALFPVVTPPPANPLTSTWPHLRCDVGLEEGEYRENCLCLALLYTIIMVHKGTSGSYRSVDCIGL